MENVNNQEQEQEQTQGWGDVQINSNMSLDMLVNFLNILNQRLVTVENFVTIPDQKGKMISITDFYQQQAQQAQEAQAQEQAQSKE